MWIDGRTRPPVIALSVLGAPQIWTWVRHTW